MPLQLCIVTCGNSTMPHWECSCFVYIRLLRALTPEWWRRGWQLPIHKPIWLIIGANLSLALDSVSTCMKVWDSDSVWMDLMKRKERPQLSDQFHCQRKGSLKQLLRHHHEKQIICLEYSQDESHRASTRDHAFLRPRQPCNELMQLASAEDGGGASWWWI